MKTNKKESIANGARSESEMSKRRLFFFSPQGKEVMHSSDRCPLSIRSDHCYSSFSERPLKPRDRRKYKNESRTGERRGFFSSSSHSHRWSEQMSGGRRWGRTTDAGWVMEFPFAPFWFECLTFIFGWIYTFLSVRKPDNTKFAP